MQILSKNVRYLGALLCCAFLFSQIETAYAQLELPRVSPAASITQRIGLTDVTITYHRPGVKGREIWGTNLAPYDGNPVPWRAGANDNTTISFTHEVTIEGAELAAGTYGLHTFPSAGDWIIALSHNSTSWGSFSYKPEEDAARVTITPQKAEHQEWLRYGYDELTANSAVAFIHWEALKVPFKIEVDVHNIVLTNIRNQLRHTAGFRARGWLQAANYCLRNDINHEEALNWIDQSIRRDENFGNLQVKSDLLAKVGRAQESNDVISRAIEIGTASDLNRYGRQLLGRDMVDDAIAVLKTNVKRNPNAWAAHNTLAQAYEKKGNLKEATKSYKKALANAPDNRKANIEGKIKELEGTD
jgi:tetratricopeptide (TPR) repeat protein